MNENINESVTETELDLSKQYNLPKEISIVKYKEVYLAIYTEGILWIVLYNEEEKNVFLDLKNKRNLEYVFKKYSEEAVLNVLIQLEAKKFENPKHIENDDKNIFIYLTNNCNQRCRHCYMYAGSINIEEISVEQWNNALDEFKQNGIKGVTFSGGEITVYKGYKEVIMHAHQIGLQVTILSNGILWNEKLVKELSQYIDEIQISIDGYDKNSYFNVRQYDGFDKAIKCVELFNKTNTKVSIAVTPLYENLEIFIDNFEKFAQKFMKKYPNVFVKLNHELIVGREVHPTQKENQTYKKKLKDLVERLYPNFYIETFVLNYENKAIRKNCGFGEISIAANGDIFWCNRIHELTSHYSILKDSVVDIIEKSKYIKEITSVDNTKICKDCEIRYICGGGCRIKYEGIKEADSRKTLWSYNCEGKKDLYEKMILSNEYFFEE